MNAPDQVLFDKIKQLPRSAWPRSKTSSISCASAKPSSVSRTLRPTPARRALRRCGTTTRTRLTTGCDPMANSSRFSFGDVLLVPLLFTDQSGTK